MAEENGDIELGGGEDEQDNEALTEILNNVWMRGLPDTNQNRCKVAQELWKEKDKLFTDRIDRKKKQSLASQNEVYQLIGFYVVFQGVLLTAVAQSSLLHCNNAWTATLLSSLTSLVTVIGVSLKLCAVRALERTIAGETITQKILLKWQQKLCEKNVSDNFDFRVTRTSEETGRREHQKAIDSATLWWLSASFLAVKAVLVAFSVTFVMSIYQILCHPGEYPYPSGGSASKSQSTLVLRLCRQKDMSHSLNLQTAWCASWPPHCGCTA